MCASRRACGIAACVVSRDRDGHRDDAISRDEENVNLSRTSVVVPNFSRRIHRRFFSARVSAGFGDRARRARRAGAMKRPREAGTRPHDLRRDPADDCETPLEAYVHVAFVLSKISQKKNVRKSALRVYDPYFCAGAASERLRALGFASASNEDVDFYAALGDTQSRVDDGSTNAPSLPAHDVLVTNPPFSGDHCRRLVAFLAARPRDKPFALLAPEYVHRKAWFAPLARKFEDMLFIVPRTRYAFVARRGGRSANASRTRCRHFARNGRCPRGDACPFAHGHPSPDAACSESAFTKKRRAAILKIATRALLSASRPSTWCGTCTAARKPRTRASPRRGAKSSKRGKRTVREPARRCASPFPSSSARRARRVFRAIFQRYGNGEWNTYDRLVHSVTMYS